MNKMLRVAVSGTGCLSALGMSPGECVENMLKGVRNVYPPLRIEGSHDIKYPVFEIKDPFKQPESRKNQDLTLTARMAIAATYQALAEAGIDPKQLKNKRVGVCMGTTVGSSLNNDQFYMDYRDQKHPDMTAIQRFLNSNPSASVAREFDLTGPVQTIVNACASGTDAIGMAASWIKAGLCDLAIAGGTDELCKTTYNGFISLNITDESPCKPFDGNRRGLNLGEGAGVLILEPETGDNRLCKDPMCFISGFGSGCDAYHLTAPHPDGIGLKQAVYQALEESRLNPDDIGFVNAHGTGTRENDKVESLALTAVMPEAPFFSTKGFTGHTLGAAGAIEAVFTIAHMQNKIIPASIGFSKADESIARSPVTENTRIVCHSAMSQSVAFGGNNAVLIFSEN